MAKKTETVYQVRIMMMKRRMGTTLGVRLTISSSTANRNETIMTRTFTSHASHDRSLNRMSAIWYQSCFCSGRVAELPKLKIAKIAGIGLTIGDFGNCRSNQGVAVRGPKFPGPRGRKDGYEKQSPSKSALIRVDSRSFAANLFPAFPSRPLR